MYKEPKSVCSYVSVDLCPNTYFMCMHTHTGPLLWPLLNPDSQTSVYTIWA